MAGEVILPFEEDPHRISNPNVGRGHLNGPNGIAFMAGWEFRASETGELGIWLPVITQDVHATTPNAKIRLRWGTAVSGTNSVKWYIKLVSGVPGTLTWDPDAAAFTANLDSSVTQASAGAYIGNQAELAIPNSMMTRGNELLGVIKRNDADGADTLAGLVLLARACIVADKA